MYTHMQGDDEQQRQLAICCLAWNPEGTTLASGGSKDNVIRLWDVSSKQCTGTLEVGNSWVHVGA
jgi:WD40 repeat protein